MEKHIDTNGTTLFEPLTGCPELYWAMDHTGGDLYDARECFDDGSPIHRSRLLFLRYPEGTPLCPVPSERGQYMGTPLFDRGFVYLLRADFVEKQVCVLRCGPSLDRAEPVCTLPLADVPSLYNLSLKPGPVLGAQGDTDALHILWPFRRSYPLGGNESFLGLQGDRLYFWAWHEDPDYREETIVRHRETGEELLRQPGDCMLLPDGQVWILR